MIERWSSPSLAFALASLMVGAGFLAPSGSRGVSHGPDPIPIPGSAGRSEQAGFELAARSGPGPAGDGEEPEPAAGRLQISDAAFAYCSFDEECPPTRILRIGASPMQFQVTTRIDKNLKGAECDFTLEILTAEEKPVFDTSFSLKHEFVPGQVSRILFKKQPPQLAKLAPGTYLYRVTVMTADGSEKADWKRQINARK